jgi:hypothetical protein
VHNSGLVYSGIEVAAGRFGAFDDRGRVVAEEPMPAHFQVSRAAIPVPRRGDGVEFEDRDALGSP